jgi:hypothetical protein
MNSSGRLGPSTYVFTLVPTGINSLDLLTGNGFLVIPGPRRIQQICLQIHNGVFYLYRIAPFHNFDRVCKACKACIFYSCLLTLVANYPLCLASTFMPIEKMRSSVSFTISTLPIEEVYLNLRCFSFLSRHKGKIRSF